MVKISIIVPVYNVEKYLERCLESLVNQSLNDIEILLINDASTDNSTTILENYSLEYSNVRVFHSAENIRQGGARNIGLRNAKGIYIAFVDSDDWVSMEMYEKLYAEAVNSNSDIVDCDYYVSDGSSILSRVESNYSNQMGALDVNKKKSLILHGGRLWTKIYRRDLFVENNILFPEKLTYEDNPVLPIILCLANKISKVNEPLYYYFKNMESTTNSKDSYHHFDRLDTSKLLVENFKKNNIYQMYKSEVDFRFCQLFYFNTIGICLSMFTNPERKYLNEIVTYMRKNYPNFYKNKYYKKFSKKTKMMILLTYFFPNTLVTMYTLKKSFKKYVEK